MGRKSNNNLIVGLDIGTSKVLVIVGETSAEGETEIIGVGHCPARGLNQGEIENMEDAVASIRHAVEEAELMANCQIYSVCAGITGSHVESLNSHGMSATEKNEVTKHDISRSIHNARAMAMPSDRIILHALPQDFIIDKREGIRNPLGMSGVRLDARVHIVTCSASALKNICKCIRRCGLEVDNVILDPLASSEAVLTKDEMNQGVCLVDIGEGTTDIAIYIGGSLRHTAVIPYAGQYVTQDVSKVLNLSIQDAEDYKKRYGCALGQMVEQNEEQVVLEREHPDDQAAVRAGYRREPITRHFLATVIESRLEEIMKLVRKEVQFSGLEHRIGAGVVLTGGTAQTDGLLVLVEEVFHLPVRLGLPDCRSGLSSVLMNPTFSTGIGLSLYSQSRSRFGDVVDSNEKGGNTLVSSIRNWFRDSF